MNTTVLSVVVIGDLELTGVRAASGCNFRGVNCVTTFFSRALGSNLRGVNFVTNTGPDLAPGPQGGAAARLHREAAGARGGGGGGP